jgi:hypothetical protein
MKRKDKVLAYRSQLAGIMAVGLLLLVVGCLTLLSNAKEAAVPATRVASQTLPDPCPSTASDRIDCYEKYFDTVVKQDGSGSALAQLEKLNKQDGSVEAICHTVIHRIGHSALKFYGTVDKAIAAGNGSEICWSGYYHGVMEQYMAKFSDSELLRLMTSICEPSDRPYSFDHYNCLHGLGHGLTIRFEQDIFKALPYCEAVTGGWEQQSCFGGVFMQNIATDGVNHKSVALDPANPIYPCNVVKVAQKESCYLIQTSQVLRINGLNYAKGFEVCDGVEKDFVSTCYMSMGRDISGNSVLDHTKIVPLCSLGKESYQRHCYIGASKNAVFNDRGTARADALCKVVPRSFKKDCEVARDQAASTL